MTACSDIYVMPSGCSIIQTYPSVVHPPTPGDGGGGGQKKFWHPPERKKKRHIDTEEDILAVLGLL